MVITEIRMRTVEGDERLRALATVTFENELAVHDVKVIYARERFFIVMPSRKNPDGTYRDVVHPINSEFRAKLEEVVIDAYHAQYAAMEADGMFAEGDDSTLIL